MPAKNAIREYAPETYYHVYNRGVAKQNIFLDEQDYKVFLSYLKTYLSAPDKSEKSPPSKKLKNYFGRVKLLAYCLMPNHFHFFAWQKEIDALTGFMRAVMIKYSMFFNKKYRRVGPVFQGKFKAVMITNEPQFVFLSKYIHRNPISLAAGTEPAAYSYSSYRNYLELINQAWLDTSEILSYFSKTKLANSYQNFIEELDDRDLPMIKEVMLDFEF